MKKLSYTFNLKLAFDFKKNSTSSTVESGGGDVQVDPNKTKSLMTMLVALGSWAGLLAISLKIVYFMLVTSSVFF